jgi:hypothetical protein
VEALLAFAAALVTFRLGGDVAARWRRRTGARELALWAAGLVAYAVASGALAWGTAAGWEAHAFRVYYLFGGLLTVPLLAAGSLVRAGRRWAGPLVLVYAGLAVGVGIGVPVHGSFAAAGIPAAQDHLAFVPARLVAVVANAVGTLALIAVALATFRRRPLGNALVILGVTVAGVGSAVAGLGEAETAAFVAVAAVLLYAGFVSAR